jgi:alanyl-tRNA synthetase
MKLDDIRKKFLDYFEAHGHRVVPSSSLVPQNDPTLLFTNAGMNQFKDMFLGQEKRDYARATSSQKCFRASGKHNDLENVGRTARHHTFFEMLGNFSFGDYFKKEAIRFAWELLTSEYGLPKQRLWVTVFEHDDEAEKLWREVTDVDPARLVRMGEKDNFWAMGEVGPCGPCSEIIMDQGPGVGCGRETCDIHCDCGRFLELWNLVFMQFNRDASGRMTPLPHPSIDTGMGLERIAAVLQGVQSNYDTDLFRAIIARIEELADKRYGQDVHQDVSMRIIAEHSRAMAFLIADGVLPSNEGRGYVLRRVMRRAGRHAKLLGLDEPVLFQVADRVVDLMAGPYPELKDKRSYLKEAIRAEEERFLQTLDAGLKILQEEISKYSSRIAKEAEIKDELNTAKGEKVKKVNDETYSESQYGRLAEIMAKRETIKKRWVLSSEIAFKLYDTYGFPLDLTETIGEDEGFMVDKEGFERAMAAQRERARESWKGSGDQAVAAIYKEIKHDGIRTVFTGYHEARTGAKVKVLLAGDRRIESFDRAGGEFQLITDRTPFYGEQGGQLGDTGVISASPSGQPAMQAVVTDTKKPLEDLYVHHCRLVSGSLRVGDTLEMAVDEERRQDIARNHSATHLLQWALRDTLGEHVQQKGSLVAPDRLRFDFTHFSPISAEELLEVERKVNARVRENAAVEVSVLPHQEALWKGAIALFGEKYGEEVRMVEMGDFSLELCGGTHTARAGDVGVFKIVSETGVAAGVRRIEALTGRGAVEYLQEQEQTLRQAAGLLKGSPSELVSKIERLQEEVKSLKKELKAAREQKSLGGEEGLLDQVQEVNGVRLLAAEVAIPDPRALRDFSDRVRAKLRSGVLVLASQAEGKAYLLVAVSKDLQDRFHAGKIAQELAPLVGGKGGGRPDLAQAGGPNPEGIPPALAKVKSLL